MRKSLNSAKLICTIDASAFGAILVVLLAVFMVAKSAPHHGPSVDWPKAKHPITMRGAGREDAVLVWIFRDGKVTFGGSVTSPAELPTQIQIALSRGIEKRVYLNIDARARYGNVSEVIDALSRAGVEKVGILVQQSESVAVLAR